MTALKLVISQGGSLIVAVLGVILTAASARNAECASLPFLPACLRARLSQLSEQRPLLSVQSYNGREEHNHNPMSIALK